MANGTSGAENQAIGYVAKGLPKMPARTAVATTGGLIEVAIFFCYGNVGGWMHVVWHSLAPGHILPFKLLKMEHTNGCGMHKRNDERIL